MFFFRIPMLVAVAMLVTGCVGGARPPELSGKQVLMKDGRLNPAQIDSIVYGRAVEVSGEDIEYLLHHNRWEVRIILAQYGRVANWPTRSEVIRNLALDPHEKVRGVVARLPEIGRRQLLEMLDDGSVFVRSGAIANPLLASDKIRSYVERWNQTGVDYLPVSVYKNPNCPESIRQRLEDTGDPVIQTLKAQQRE